MDYTTQNRRSYRVLTHSDREEIMCCVNIGLSLRSIAKKLDRHPSVISRELKANSTEDGKYQAYWAQNRSNDRRRESRQRPRIPDQETRAYLRENLEKGWSPEQISGRLLLENPAKYVCHETIYLYIYEKEPELANFLPRTRKKRRKRQYKNAKRSMIPDRTGIEERPEEVDTRTTTGHWEADTAVSRESTATLAVMQERKLGLTLIKRMPENSPAEMNAAIIDRMGVLPAQTRKTITFDNGQENRYHKVLCDTLKVKTYFCHPYSSWEKGSVENAIGLIRRFLPKKTDFALITNEEIAYIEYLLNTRPRKRFGYRTPYEMAESVAFTP